MMWRRCRRGRSGCRSRMRSGGGHEPRRAGAELMGDDALNEKGEEGPLVLLTGRADRHEALDEAIAVGALRPVAALAPEDGRPQLPLGRIVRGFDTGHGEEGP